MIKRVYGARDNEGRFASWPRVPSERRPPGPGIVDGDHVSGRGTGRCRACRHRGSLLLQHPLRQPRRQAPSVRRSRPRRGRPASGRPDQHRQTRPDQTRSERPSPAGRPTAPGRSPPSGPPPRRGLRRAKADTGPDPVADFDQVPRAAARPLRARTAHAARTRGRATPRPGIPGPTTRGRMTRCPVIPTATDPKLGTAARGASETRPTARTAKPRRRVGFRKGADLDEELWPTESFGGVSDEQFWDDLASDKPLATTARTAQQDPPSRNRLSAPAPGAGLITGPRWTAAGLDTGPATGPAGRPGPGGRQETR